TCAQTRSASGQLLRELELLQKRLAAKEPPGRINAQEEYEALKSFVDGSLKPQISRLTRMNGEKDLDLRANEERIRKLLNECGERRGVGARRKNYVSTVKGGEDDRELLLDALLDAEESARIRESDLLTFVDSLQNAADRYVVEKEELVALLESVRSDLRSALNERDKAMSDVSFLQEECVNLRDQLLGKLLPQFPVGERKLLEAYLEEVQRRRAAENELYRGLSLRGTSLR
ncbi:uncharacterized protein Tco025E_09957, partial [Trypanosoma conorhini]